jgi:hypothetical protein
MSIDHATPSEWDALRKSINQPQHYQSKDGLECIDVIQAQLSDEEFVGYLRGNAIKYQWRMMKKHDRPQRDAGKLQWYVNRLMEVLGAN